MSGQTKVVLGPPVGYITLLDAATTMKLEKEEKEGGGFNRTPIRPSSAGNCTRELYYQLQEFHGKAKYPKEVNTPATHRLLNLGHSVEYHIIKQLDLLNGVIEVKYKQQVLSMDYLKAENDPRISQWLEGSIDAVFVSDEWKAVVDFKSKKDKFSGTFKTDWDKTTDKLANMSTVQRVGDDAVFWVEDLDAFLEELNDPFFAANFKQVNLYACSTFLKERGINHGAIIQYNKNDSRLREVRFKPSQKLYDETVNKFRTVIKALDEDREQLATRDYVLGNVKCAFCKYNKQCWGESTDPLKAFFKTFPNKEWPKDTNRMGDLGRNIDDLMAEYEGCEDIEKKRRQLEEAVVKALEGKANKVRLSNGRVYEVKRLKDSVVLRRSKT